MKTLILMLIAMSAPEVHAGVGAHGGNTVFCPNQSPVTLDYYNARLPTASGRVAVVDITSMDEGLVFNLIRSRFDGSPFQEIFDEHAALLGPMSDWIAADLKSIDDSNEPYALPADCERKTAAARQGTSMYIDLSVSRSLSGAQLALLRAHEILYEISGGDSSAPVRDLFRVLLSAKPDPALLARKMQPFGHFAAWEYMTTGVWENIKVLPGYFMVDVLRPAPSGLFAFMYRETDPKNPGSYKVASQYVSKCDLATQSCEIIDQLDYMGTGPSLQYCKLKFSGTKTMILDNCSRLGGSAQFFKK